MLYWAVASAGAVSYTHLDVYKRQVFKQPDSRFSGIDEKFIVPEYGFRLITELFQHISYQIPYVSSF